jgi:CO/xanthine dehydrogenase FAD-binding subunit
VAVKKRRVHVTTPGDLTDLLWLAAERPDSYLVAGGTDLMRREMPEGFPERIIDLTGVGELARLSRTERWLDLGATLTLSRLLAAARNVLPRTLLTAVGSIGTPALRVQATIGGNVCLASPLSDTIAPLAALDARVELRSSGGLRWLPVQMFVASQGRPALRPGEVLCKVRIPLADWDFGVFRKVSPKAPPSQSILGFCGLARVQRDILSDVRFAVSGLYQQQQGAPLVYRDRAAEVALSGQHLPLSRRLIEQHRERLFAGLARRPEALPPSSYQAGAAVRLFDWFFDQLSHLHSAR